MKVLLLGDSIRMFYQKEVTTQLGVGYEVFAPQENGRLSAAMLKSRRFWLKEFPTPEIIHFNAGLWDTAVLYPEDGCFLPATEYVRNMHAILRELKATGAKIIFATTTPVSGEKAHLQGPMPPTHRNEDIARYNRAVLNAFEKEDIVVNDLWGAMHPEKEKYLSEDMIHPNEAGVKLLGGMVADAIKRIGGYHNEKAIEASAPLLNKDEKTVQ